MKKKFRTDDIVSLEEDWNGSPNNTAPIESDENNEMPYSGRAIQKFIRESLKAIIATAANLQKSIDDKLDATLYNRDQANFEKWQQTIDQAEAERAEAERLREVAENERVESEILRESTWQTRQEEIDLWIHKFDEHISYCQLELIIEYIKYLNRDKFVVEDGDWTDFYIWLNERGWLNDPDEPPKENQCSCALKLAELEQKIDEQQQTIDKLLSLLEQNSESKVKVESYENNTVVIEGAIKVADYIPEITTVELEAPEADKSYDPDTMTGTIK